jgi:polyisoprenoid-binding protein YceI
MALHDISSAGETHWEVDPENTSIEFSIGKSLHRVRGRFPRVYGWVEVPENGTDTTVHVEIDAARIDTRLEARDRHLRSRQFLDVKRFPTISFVSTHVDELGPRRLRVTGALTIHGLTQSIAIDATVERQDGERAHITAHTAIDRRDFKVGPKAMGLFVGNEVTVQIALVLRAR